VRTVKFRGVRISNRLITHQEMRTERAEIRTRHGVFENTGVVQNKVALGEDEKLNPPLSVNYREIYPNVRAPKPHHF
jgi:hypothetical protein